jgi:hypothetical protein
MFGIQADRLLREKWPDATQLAQELFVMLGSPDIPTSTNAPMTLNQPPGSTEAPLVINVNGNGPAITINGPTTTTNITEGGIETPPVPDTGGGGGGGGANAVPGTILSGSGDSYVFESTDGTVLNVTQGQIDSSQTIPAGTFALAAIDSNGDAWIQVPVWL